MGQGMATGWVALLGYPQGPWLQKIARFQIPPPPQLTKADAKGEWVLKMRSGQQTLGRESPDLGELVHNDVQAVSLHVQCLCLVSCLQDLKRQVP